MQFTVDTERWTITLHEPNGNAARSISCFDEEGFSLLSQCWLKCSWQRKYSYQFRWLGRPIIQLPTDIIMMQDLIHRVRPTLIIETGIAHGGSVVFHASLLKLLHGDTPTHACRPHVIAVDIDIRLQNCAAIDQHSLRPMLTLIEGSSTSPVVVEQIRHSIQPTDTVMVVLDSNHTREHVIAELNQYAPLVSRNSALVVMDSVMAQLASLPDGDPTWLADNPATAVQQFLLSPAGHDFVVRHTYDAYALTHSPSGILLRSNE